ncbi:DHH family phosphoesterase [Clostridium sp.]|uniref:DHH family phosphoesterase n=1 Tax=Clostridium sp. TaxID=1506 RepID=UPI003216F93E
MEYSMNRQDNDPFLLGNMKIALNRIVKAINEREKIVIYGYHDFDSVCAISLLMLVLRYVNSDVEYYIPSVYRNDRNLNKEDIENNLLCLGANLIITVGCGVKSKEEIQLCKENNIDIIVTDYHNHIVEDKNCITINTCQTNCNYPFKDFTGCSLIYKFIEVIASYYKISCTQKYLDLVMMGIITTGIEIEEENRYFVEEGCKKLNKTNNYGVKALIREHERNYGGNMKFYDEGIIKLLPKMISKNKLDNARIIVELFTTNDSYRAKQISKFLYKEVMMSFE